MNYKIFILAALISSTLAFGCNLESEKSARSDDDDSVADDDDGGADVGGSKSDDDDNSVDDDDNITTDDDDTMSDDDDTVTDDDDDDTNPDDDDTVTDDDDNDTTTPDACADAGGVCWPLYESRPCPDGYEHPPGEAIVCTTEDGVEGECCLPFSGEECYKNTDCAVVPTGCCQCGLEENEFTVVPASERAEYEKNLGCQNIDCDMVCPDVEPYFLPFPICENNKCDIRFPPIECVVLGSPDCTPSETMTEMGWYMPLCVPNCPSNWGECGCTYTEEDICSCMGDVSFCEYDEMGCPTCCECFEPPYPLEDFYTFPEIPEMYACLEDSDCIEVPKGCDKCGGISINKDYRSDWFDSYKDYCFDHATYWEENMACTGVPLPGKPTCYYGRCSFENPPAQNNCPENDGCPCSSRPCEQDMFGCPQPECLSRFTECESHADCSGGLCWLGDGYCHPACSADPKACDNGKKCYEVVNHYGDLDEVINVCLKIN